VQQPGLILIELIEEEATMYAEGPRERRDQLHLRVGRLPRSAASRQWCATPALP
jgi:hypothetical protein